MNDELRAELHELYRRLHRSPELSMQEHATAELIRDRMERLGYETSGCGGTGVVAVFRNGEGPVVAFRAELDALPVGEDTGVDFASSARGTLSNGTAVPVMHACGHDLHIACAVGAAAVLADSRDQWSGTVVFVFQPGEETGEGALAMLADGLWDRAPIPEVIFAQHVSTMAAGTVELSGGVAMAMADNWSVTVHGRGGHGSQPETALDPIVLAAHMIVRIQSVVSREVGAHEAAVVTIGSIHAGSTANVIPASAEFTMTIRSLEPAVHARLLAALRRTLDAEAIASGAPSPDIVERQGFPRLYNEPASTARAAADLAAALGAENVSPRPPSMGSEDFGRLGSHLGIPGVYWFLGGMLGEPAVASEPPPMNHSPSFIPVLEPTLTTGVSAVVAVMLARLRAINPLTTESEARR